jgi:integrase
MIDADEINAIGVSRRDSALYAFLGGTGCRISEALALTVADWEKGAGIIHVRASKTTAGVREIDLPGAFNSWLQQNLNVPLPAARLFPAALTTYRERARGVTGAFH